MQPTDWRHLTDLAQVKTGRQSGESLLKYHLHVMLAHANAEQNDNIVHKIDGIVGLGQHIDWLYKQEQQEEDNKIRDEKYADYVEALFSAHCAGRQEEEAIHGLLFADPHRLSSSSSRRVKQFLLLHRTMLGARTTALCAGRGSSSVCPQRCVCRQSATRA